MKRGRYGISRLSGVVLGLVMGIVVTAVSCGGRESRTTDTSSSVFGSVDEKRVFLERYVTFRRSYEELEFHVVFSDGGDGRVPGPTEWDVRVMAVVPAGEIGVWIEGMGAVNDEEGEWVAKVPGVPGELAGFEWFREGGKTVGVNRDRRMVLYRHLAI